MASKPNPERIYATIVRILERRYGVKIEYILKTAPERRGNA